MKKDVLLSIAGLQYEFDKEDAVEVISIGEYYNKDGKHYVKYEEIMEEVEGVTNCTLKATDHQIDILKRGANNVHMVFEVNKKNMTYYQTPFGDLQIGIFTKIIGIVEEEDKILIEINYELDINYSFVSDCKIQIKITPRKIA
ncbi:MAG: DUF1934 domain-containing protein [Anaerocolumna sp.]